MAVGPCPSFGALARIFAEFTTVRLELQQHAGMIVLTGRHHDIFRHGADSPAGAVAIEVVQRRAIIVQHAHGRGELNVIPGRINTHRPSSIRDSPAVVHDVFHVCHTPAPVVPIFFHCGNLTLVAADNRAPCPFTSLNCRAFLETLTGVPAEITAAPALLDVRTGLCARASEPHLISGPRANTIALIVAVVVMECSAVFVSFAQSFGLFQVVVGCAAE